ESLLFVAGEPLPVSALLGLVRDIQPGLSGRALRGVVDQLRDELREGARGVRLAEVAGGYQLRTPSEFSPLVRKLITRRPPRMTRPTLETLAIIAYRQPVTRSEIEDIRGVDSGPVLKHLLEKKLVKILGRKEDVGRPLIYGTTKEFLEFFSLKDLKSLPTLKDFVELSDEHRAQLGLEAREAAVEKGAGPEATELQPALTDDYTPVGEDEVLQELSQALDELKDRNRELKRDVLGKKVEEDGEEAGEQTGAPVAEVVEPGSSEVSASSEGSASSESDDEGDDEDLTDEELAETEEDDEDEDEDDEDDEDDDDEPPQEEL
ncbi:MAG TPA: SMC-Scp complex subunit ScpB, partial [Myxococcota bacterium]|nr:SMC-Scp complex subunit ScpB [Myxococcota bacterium]